MALTADQIITVQLMIGYTSYDATETLVAGLSAEQEVRVIALIDKWLLIADKHTKVSRVGSIYFDVDKDRDRLSLVNQLRLILGLSQVTDLDDLSYQTEIAYTTPTIGVCGCE